MSHYSNPTANAAIGAIDREIKQMKKRARALMVRNQQGLLTLEEVKAARRQFKGIHHRFLVAALTGDPNKILADDKKKKT